MLCDLTLKDDLSHWFHVDIIYKDSKVKSYSTIMEGLEANSLPFLLTRTTYGGSRTTADQILLFPVCKVVQENAMISSIRGSWEVKIG